MKEREKAPRVKEARPCEDMPVLQHCPGVPALGRARERPWPRRFNGNTLPQYDRDYDPKEFLMKFEAAVESNGATPQRRRRRL
jgi:hypothetical protein